MTFDYGVILTAGAVSFILSWAFFAFGTLSTRLGELENKAKYHEIAMKDKTIGVWARIGELEKRITELESTIEEWSAGQ